MGGSSEYIKIELLSEKLEQYGLTMSDVTSAISTANLAYPSGEAVAGNLELSVTTSLETEQVGELQDSNCYRHRRAGYAVGCSQYL